MGLLSWLFGFLNKKSEIPIRLNGPGSYSMDAVGESHYQANLKMIAGEYSEDGVEKDVLAKLIHENDNPYDNKAISIEISGYKVGHLSKSDARYYRRKILEHGYGEQTAICNAKIRGGWKRSENDIGLYGVILDLPHEFIEGSENEHAEELETENRNPNTIIFQADHRNLDEFKKCKIGDYLNLWVPDSKTTKVHIFRSGTVGGSGRIGYVPRKYSCIISIHLREGLPYQAKILDLNTGKIECSLISKHEVAAKRAIEIKRARERIEASVTQKYRRTPKDNFSILVRLLKNHNQKIGNILFLEKKPKEFYLQKPESLCVEFADKLGNIVAEKTTEEDYILRILRAHFSNYSVTIKIISIREPDLNSLPFVDIIEAKAIVTYESEK